MTELFGNIRQEVKDTAYSMWNIAVTQKNPIEAAKFINDTTNYYANIYSEEEMRFIRFYIQTQLEMMKG